MVAGQRATPGDYDDAEAPELGWSLSFVFGLLHAVVACAAEALMFRSTHNMLAARLSAASDDS